MGSVDAIRVESCRRRIGRSALQGLWSDGCEQVLRRPSIDWLTGRIIVGSAKNLGNNQSAKQRRSVFKPVLDPRLVLHRKLYCISLGQVNLCLRHESSQQQMTRERYIL